MAWDRQDGKGNIEYNLKIFILQKNVALQKYFYVTASLRAGVCVPPHLITCFIYHSFLSMQLLFNSDSSSGYYLSPAVTVTFYKRNLRSKAASSITPSRYRVLCSENNIFIFSG